MSKQSPEPSRIMDAAALLASIVNSSDDAIISITLDGVITLWNCAAEKMFGYTAAEAIDQNMELIIPPGRGAKEDDVLARVHRGDKIEHEESVRQAKDGRTLDLTLTVSPIRDSQDRIIGASMVARDISEQKRAHEGRERLAAIVDSSDDAIVSKTLDGVITSWNRGAENIFGYSAPEAVGQHITLIIPSERHAEEEDVLAHIRRGEKIDHFETVRQTKDGRKLDISLTVSPVRDFRNRIIGASKVARDITARRRAEEERETIVKLEQAARTAAEEASRLKDDFLATVSHELRNPLSSIVGWSGLLRSGKLDQQASRRAIEAISQAARSQDQIISDLLDVSRIISGRLRLDIRPLQLVDLLETAIETARPALDAKQIELHTMLDPAAGPMVGDPDRLQQVFWNLLSNAVKFTPRGGLVQILSQRVNSHVEITVTDTGIGIPAELLPHVFDRFRQGESGTKRQSSGLGLGLAIVKHLVELHGGTVHAQSNGSGKGAIFTVRLPIMISPFNTHEEDRVHPTTGELLLANLGPSLENLRVLVVDDEPGAREVTAAILVQVQAEVRTAEGAGQALDVMNGWQPDVIVADIGMPNVDGFEFIRQVRRRGSQAGGAIPAVALTAYARTQDRLRVLSEGYQMHVPKPIQPAELITVVASLSKRIGGKTQ